MLFFLLYNKPLSSELPVFMTGGIGLIGVECNNLIRFLLQGNVEIPFKFAKNYSLCVQTFFYYILLLFFFFFFEEYKFSVGCFIIILFSFFFCILFLYYCTVYHCIVDYFFLLYFSIHLHTWPSF